MKVSMVNDRKLPALHRAMDDREIRGILSAALKSHSQNGSHAVSSVRHEILKYKPGKHCVIKYWVEWDGNHSTSSCVIGKLYRKNRGQQLFQKFQNLWSATQNEQKQENLFRMPRPLAYVSELGMILQTMVPGRSLAGLSDFDDLNNPIRSVARNLAALHSLSLPSGEKKTMTDHFKKYCHPGAQVMIAECPDLAHLVESILVGLELETEQGLKNAPMCPVHGDLGLSQIHISEDQAFFVDFDSFCLSHPALDIANFITALAVNLEAGSEELKKTFINTYLQFHSSETLTGLRVYQAFIYLRRAMICFRLRTGNEWQHQARELLKTGIGFLPPPTGPHAPRHSSMAHGSW